MSKRKSGISPRSKQSNVKRALNAALEASQRGADFLSALRDNALPNSQLHEALGGLVRPSERRTLDATSRMFERYLPVRQRVVGDAVKALGSSRETRALQRLEHLSHDMRMHGLAVPTSLFPERFAKEWLAWKKLERRFRSKPQLGPWQMQEAPSEQVCGVPPTSTIGPYFFIPHINGPYNGWWGWNDGDATKSWYGDNWDHIYEGTWVIGSPSQWQPVTQVFKTWETVVEVTDAATCWLSVGSQMEIWLTDWYYHYDWREIDSFPWTATLGQALLVSIETQSQNILWPQNGFLLGDTERVLTLSHQGPREWDNAVTVGPLTLADPESPEWPNHPNPFQRNLYRHVRGMLSCGWIKIQGPGRVVIRETATANMSVNSGGYAMVGHSGRMNLCYTLTKSRPYGAPA